MVTGNEIDPKNPIDPEYTYIKGDLTKAYSSKVSDFKRSFMFLNLFDEKVPAALIVFDKITSSDATFKKTWLLHGVEEPLVNGNQTIFSRTYQSPVTPSGYNGKMTVDTMLPKAEDTVINIVGGEDDGYSNVNGTDYTGYPAMTKVDEGNTYRMELSPKGARKTDYFLNVLQVSDNDKNYYKPKMLENELFYGVQIKDRAVLFSKSGNRVGDNLTFELSDELLKVTLCDMKAGKWSITQSGRETFVFATEDGGILSFEASGSVSVRYVSSEIEAVGSEIVLGKENPVNVKISGQYVHCKVEPELVNGKAVLPLSTISEWFKINRIDNGGKITLTNKYATVSVERGSSLLTIGDTTTDMGVTVFEKDGEFMVPASDVVEAFGGNSEWRKYYNLIDIELPVQDYSLSESYAKVKNVINDGGEIDGDNVPENAVDGNGDTIWAALGQGRYIDIELDGFYTIDKAEILFNPNGNRTAKFKIQISDDGVHYTTVLSDVSDGALEAVAWEKYDFDAPVTAKYIRYIANGSNISEWNAIKEIRFREYRQSEETLEAEVDSEGKISAKAFVCNEGRYPKKCIVAVAQYSEDGRLIKVDLSEQHTVAPRIDYPYEFKVVTEKMSCAESVKAFLWDEIASAKPYKAMVVY